MTYLEGTKELIFDSNQQLAQASATYTLMREEWDRGPTNVRLDAWVWSGTLTIRHIAGRN